MSNERKDYESLKGLLNGTQIQTLDRKVLIDCVLDRTLSELGTCQKVYVLHDPCDIRKPHSSDLEHLGKVLSLQKTVVDGYSSFNSIAVLADSQSVHLLDSKVYSNRMPDYVSQETVKLIQSQGANYSKADLVNKAGEVVSLESQDLVHNKRYINGTVIAKSQIQSSSVALKQSHSGRELCHILDREFDKMEVFEQIDALKDTFVVRAKLSRLSTEKVPQYTTKGKLSKRVVYKKLVDKNFENKSEYLIDKLLLKGKNYQSVTSKIEWESAVMTNDCGVEKTYQVVRITLLQENKPIFDHPMLLITNQEIYSSQDACQVYKTYLLRFKIELVFRFLKQQLGWETFQVRDFKSIENLLALAFFLVGYFDEIKEKLTKHPLSKLLCKLVNSKGIISMFFLLEGLKKLIEYQQVQQWMNQENISQKQIVDLIKELQT